MTRGNCELRMLNLNVGGLNAEFDKLKLFLVECNNDASPLSVITLQETHLTSEIDVNYFQLPGYNMVNDFARLNSKGVNPCSNMGGIILWRNIHSACGMYCVAQSAPSF